MVESSNEELLLVHGLVHCRSSGLDMVVGVMAAYFL